MLIPDWSIFVVLWPPRSELGLRGRQAYRKRIEGAHVWPQDGPDWSNERPLEQESNLCPLGTRHFRYRFRFRNLH